MTERPYDIIVCGATGFTGKLVSEYLSAHKESFKFAIAGRNQAKLDDVARDLPGVETVLYDAANFEQCEALARQTKVVLTLAGPYMIYGEPLLKACASHGTHYVDLTGEPHWHLVMIQKYEELAQKTGAIVVPACGFDSIPGDLTSFLAAKTLREAGATSVSRVRAGYKAQGGMSGGTLASGLASFTHAEPELVKAGSQPWALSPIEGKTPVHEFVTQDPITKKVGGFWMMALSNEAIVRRSAGLLEQAHSDERYGPLFDYSEFMETPSLLSARILSFTAAVGTWIFQHSSLFRSLLTRFGPQPGTGPTELDKGCFFRVTTSAIGLKEDGSQVSVKSVMFGDGDPGYRATSWMIAESALLLALTPRESLPTLAQRGGLLTPATAMGELLAKRLVATKRFTFSQEVVEGGAA